jgi:ribosomal protein S27AE
MVLKFQCPKCGKGDKSELVEVLPERKYRMKCGDCECTYILTASADDESKAEKPSKGCSCPG